MILCAEFGVALQCFRRRLPKDLNQMLRRIIPAIRERAMRDQHLVAIPPLQGLDRPFDEL